MSYYLLTFSGWAGDEFPFTDMYLSMDSLKDWFLEIFDENFELEIYKGNYYICTLYYGDIEALDEVEIDESTYNVLSKYEENFSDFVIGRLIDYGSDTQHELDLAKEKEYFWQVVDVEWLGEFVSRYENYEAFLEEYSDNKKSFSYSTHSREERDLMREYNEELYKNIVSDSYSTTLAMTKHLGLDLYYPSIQDIF